MHYIKSNIRLKCEEDLDKFKTHKILNYVPQKDTNQVSTLKVMEKYISDQSFIIDTVSNFCLFLEKEGYTIKENNNKNLLIDDLDEISNDNKKRNKNIFNCPHTDRKHYAKVI